MAEELISSDRNITFNVDDVSEDSLRLTSYRLAGNMFVNFKKVKGGYEINCKLKDGFDDEFSESQKVKDVFIELLNDEVLRERIREETKDLRNLIIATTFSGILKDE